jgi:diacylglycerol kinase (ATP)
VSETPTRWVAIQRNPRSGRGTAAGRLRDLIRELRRRGFGVRSFRHRDHLSRWIAESEHRGQLVGLVAAGGDGTVADLFNRFPGVRLAILPMGTENLLSRYLGIPRSGIEVARMIDEGRIRRLDLGELGQRRFALMVSAGFDAAVVHSLHEARTGNISRASYFQPILDSLRKYDYPPMRIIVDGRPMTPPASLALVVNIPVYALGLPIAESACSDDGLLDVRLFERGSVFQTVRYLCNLALNRHERLPDVRSEVAKTVRIEAERPVPLQADGDPAGETPVDIRILPGALEVFVPAGKTSVVLPRTGARRST